jgi:hypothetical protein
LNRKVPRLGARGKRQPPESTKHPGSRREEGLFQRSRLPVGGRCGGC